MRDRQARRFVEGCTASSCNCRQTTMRFLSLLRHALIIVLACAVGLTTAEPLTPRQVTSSMRRVADWQIDSWQKDGFKKPKYNWTYCAAYGHPCIGWTDPGLALLRLLAQRWQGSRLADR